MNIQYILEHNKLALLILFVFILVFLGLIALLIKAIHSRAEETKEDVLPKLNDEEEVVEANEGKLQQMVNKKQKIDDSVDDDWTPDDEYEQAIDTFFQMAEDNNWDTVRSDIKLPSLDDVDEKDKRDFTERMNAFANADDNISAENLKVLAQKVINNAKTTR